MISARFVASFEKVQPGVDDAVVALPLNAAVIVPALKFPEASLATIVDAVFAVALLSPSSKSAFKLLTRVVDDTTNGAVPVATLEMNWFAWIGLYEEPVEF